MNEDKLSDSFIQSIQNKLNDLNIDYSEILLDSFIENEAVKEIPIIKTIATFAKIGITIKNQFLIKKILRFLKELGPISFEEKQKFIEDLSKSEKRDRIVDNLLIIIDRLDHDEKAQIMGKLFKSYIHNSIDLEMFFRLINILEKVYIDDVIILNGHYNRSLSEDTRIAFMYKLDSLVKNNLANYGLMRPIFGDNSYERKLTRSTNMEIKIKDYEVSLIGRTLIENGF